MKQNKEKEKKLKLTQYTRATCHFLFKQLSCEELLLHKRLEAQPPEHASHSVQLKFPFAVQQISAYLAWVWNSRTKSLWPPADGGGEAATLVRLRCPREIFVAGGAGVSTFWETTWQ